MKLAEYIDTEKLRRHVNDGTVTARRHNTLPLTIYCYGRKAVYDQIWDDVTTKTRGLIVDDSGEIIARPYEKFFAVGQHPSTNPLTIRDMDANFGPPVIAEKVNGCLGIFWKYGIHWGIASKGSFHSPHAEFATKWMEQHIEEYGNLVFPEGYTPVFEIICQEVQPHVIKYPEDGLVLLSLVNIETGEESNQNSWYAKKNCLIRPTSFNGIPLEMALSDDASGFEGYVLTYNIPGQAPFKVKVKFPTFLKNRKEFYEEQKLKAEPEKGKHYEDIRTKAASIVTAALAACTEQKEFAEFFQKPENVFYAPVCFSMLNYDEDKERQKRAIWRLCEKVAA